MKIIIFCQKIENTCFLSVQLWKIHESEQIELQSNRIYANFLYGLYIYYRGQYAVSNTMHFNIIHFIFIINCKKKYARVASFELDSTIWEKVICPYFGYKSIFLEQLFSNACTILYKEALNRCDKFLPTVYQRSYFIKWYWVVLDLHHWCSRHSFLS